MQWLQGMDFTDCVLLVWGSLYQEYPRKKLSVKESLVYTTWVIMSFLLISSYPQTLKSSLIKKYEDKCKKKLTKGKFRNYTKATYSMEELLNNDKPLS